MSLNLIGVIRLSTDEQAREGKAGLDRQRHDIATIQAQTGAKIIRTIEVIESGSMIRDDLQFQQMFRDVADPSVDGIALSALDRLVRPANFTDFSVLDHFRGKRIFTPNGPPLDTSTQSGFMEASFRAMFAGMEKQEIKRRTMGGKARNREKGWCVQGEQTLARGVLYNRETRKYFYDLDPKLEWKRPNNHRPGDALLIRRAFHLLMVEDLSFEAIAATIGNGYTGRGVKCSIKNPIWIGFKWYPVEATGATRKAVTSGRNRSVMKRRIDPPMKRVIEEPLVTPELWERAQEIIRKRGLNGGKRKAIPRALLSGVIHCGVCGKPWYWRCRGHHDYLPGSAPGVKKQSSPSREHYYCSSNNQTKREKREGIAKQPCGAKSLQRQAVDDAVSDILTGKMLEPEFLQEVVRLQKSQAIPVVDNQRAREREIEALKVEKTLLLKAYTKKHISEEMFDHEAKEIDTRMLAVHTLYPQPTVYPWTDARELLQIMTKAFAAFKRAGTEIRRALLRRAIQRITINAQMICSITFHGGFLGEFAESANLVPHSTVRWEFSATPNLTIEFPQPIKIKEVDYRRRVA